MSKLWNKNLSLKLNKNKTLFTLFKVLANEALLKSRSLDLHNRLIFDNFIKPYFLNLNYNAFRFSKSFFSNSFFRRIKFNYLFFNLSFAIFSSIVEDSNAVSKKLILRRQFCSIVFTSLGSDFLKSRAFYLNNNSIFYWSFNLSLVHLKKKNFLTDIDFLYNLKKTFINEEGKRLYTQNIFSGLPFFLRIFNRNYTANNFLKNIFFFVQNVDILKGSFNTFFLIFIFKNLISFFFFLVYFCYSLFFFIDFLLLFFLGNNINK